jgi:hypothetical protein
MQVAALKGLFKAGRVKTKVRNLQIIFVCALTFGLISAAELRLKGICACCIAFAYG